MRKSVGMIVTLTAAAALATGCSASNSASDAASSAAAVASSAAAQAQSAASSALGQVQETAGSQLCNTLSEVKTELEAQTGGTVTVGEAQAAGAKINAKLDAVKQDAGAIKSVIVSGLQSAENAYLQTLAGQPASTPLSQASPQAQSAAQAVSKAYAGVATGLGCDG